MIKKSDLGLYALLFVASCLLAYWASLPRDVEHSHGEQEWGRIDLASVAEIRYEGEERHVVIKRKGEKFWVHVSAKDQKKDENTAKSIEFLANDRLTKALKRFDPIEVKRVVGKVEANKLQEFGLDKIEKRFVIASTEKPILDWVIGKRLYGSSHVYVLDKLKDQVILIALNLLNDFEQARSSLFERNVFNEALSDVSRIVVRANAKEITIYHNQKNKAGELIWGKENGQEEVAQYKSFAERLKKLRILDYSDGAVKQVLLMQTPVVEMALVNKDGGETQLKVYKYTTQPKESKTASQSDSFEYWVQSSYIGPDVFVKISKKRGDEILADLPIILE